MIECIFDDPEDLKEKKKLMKLIKLFENEYFLKTRGNGEIFAKKTEYNIHIYPRIGSSIEEIMPKNDKPSRTYSIKNSGASIKILNQIYKISFSPVTDER